MNKILLKSVFLCLMCVTLSAHAQMEFSFSGISGVTTKDFSNGTTLVEFPVGTDLTTAMSTVSATVGGTSVSLSEIVPNPSTLSLTDDQIVVFYYKGNSYQFRFSEGKYFTAIIMSDPHIEHSGHDATSVANMRAYISQMVKMGQAGGPSFEFDALPGYVPTCDIALSLGDMDKDSQTDCGQFTYAHNGFNAAGIPFVTLVGNHDLVPDYWTGTDPDKGLTYGISGGSTCNDRALSVVTAELDTAVSNGIENLQRFTDGTSHTQAQPFTFTFNGVRFYCGQTYWFQKPYSKPGPLSSAKYYAPDGVIDALDTFVDSHASEPSVWMQHYPFVAGSDCDRWWLDQNDYGLYIKTQDSSEYGTDQDLDIWTDATAASYATIKKNKLAEIINKTTNPVHFSGHTHSYSVNTYAGVTDYTVAATGYNDGGYGGTYIVLMKGNKGIVEIQQAHFSETNNTCYNGVEMTEFDASADTRDNAALAGLVASMTSLNSSASNSGITSAITTAKAATTESAVTSALSEMSTAFANYYTSVGTSSVDVTALLGDNTDFETAQGTVLSTNSNVYPQTGWNEHLSSFTNSGNAQYIHMRQRTDDGASSTTSLYMRSKWQAYTCKDQIVKQVALPVGTYTLSVRMKKAGSYTTNLNYYEINGVRTEFSPTTSWSTQTATLSVGTPSLFTLSFGFTGGVGSTESAISVDDITLVCTSVESPYKVALAAAKAAVASYESADAGAATSAVAQYEWTDEELATKSSAEIEKAIAVLNNGTTIAENTQVATSLITNADFTGGYTGTSTSGSKVQTPNGWTFDNTLSGWRDTYVDATNKLFNMYASTVTLSELYQTLSNMPNGSYILSADFCTEADGGYMYGDGGTKTSVALGTTSATGAFTFDSFSVTFDVEDNEMTIGVSTTANFYQVKNIKLVYSSNIESAEVSAYKTALALCKTAVTSNEGSVAGAATAAVEQYEWTDAELSAKSTDEIVAATAVLNNGAVISNAGQDATSLVSNVDFTGGYTSGTASSGRVQIPTDWTFTYTLSGWNDCFVDASSKFFNAWAGTITRAELYQTVSNLPNGVYRMTADVMTDVNDGTSTIALYLNPANSSVARSEEVAGTKNTYSNYSCAADVVSNSVAIGIRSDRAYYKIANIALTYVGATAEAETDASYLRQDYFWNGRNALEFDASADKYANATGTVIYPNQPNQLITAASATQFANTDNKIVSGTCANLVITDGYPMQVSNAFTATSASYSREMSGKWGTVILPFDVNSSEEYKFYELVAVDTESSENGLMVFSSVNKLTAGTPSVFVADGSFDVSESSVNVTTTASSSADYITNWQMQGAYEATEIDVTASSSNYYYISGSNFYHATGTLTINPFRACFVSSAASEAKECFVTQISSVVNAIESVGKADNVAVVNKDGSVVISSDKDSDYSVFNASGQIVQKGRISAGDNVQISLPTGIYIINGVKVAVK